MSIQILLIITINTIIIQYILLDHNHDGIISDIYSKNYKKEFI